MTVASPSPAASAGGRRVDARTLPGPRGAPLVGALPSILREGMFPFLLRCRERYGDAFRVPLVGQRSLALLAHPDAFEAVLVSQRDAFEKGWFYAPARAFVGQGLVTSEGAYWARQRRMMQPTFRPRCIHALLPAMAACVDDMLDVWERRARTGEVFDLYAEMMRLTQRIVGRTLFGVDLGATSQDTTRAVTESIEIVGDRISAGLNIPLAIPTPKNRRFKRALRDLDHLIYGIIEHARRHPDRDAPTLLDSIIAARDEESGESMTDAQIRDEILTLYLAGHETTALTLTWTFAILARHAEVAARVADEAARAESPTPSDPGYLDSLTYIRMVIDEVLRFRPPAWMVGRVATREVAVAGHRIPAGCGAMLGIYFLHRHPDFWDDPESFRPERFTAEAIAARHRYAYLPFITGPRVCIGNRFSLYESALAISMIARRFRVMLASDEAIGLHASATLRPDRPVRVRVAAL